MFRQIVPVLLEHPGKAVIMTRFALIGYRCTGKSSVGKKLASRMGVPFFDSDMIIMDRAGTSIADIVATEGWRRFRKCEEEVIYDLASVEDAVIALGGGALDNARNRAVLERAQFRFVWLTADPETIMARMTADENTDRARPSLLNEKMEAETRRMLARREPVYRDAADLICNTSHKSIDSVVDKLYHDLFTKDISWQETHSEPSSK